MSEKIKIKYDLGLKVFEYEGPYELFDTVLERIKKVDLATDVTAVATKKKAGNKVNKKTKLGAQAENKAKPSKKASAKKISSEKFDIYGDGAETPSLESFYNSIEIGNSNAEKIVVIAYYIVEILGEELFTDGQIEFAFKMLKIDRPTHLRQIITNAKNEKDWFEKVDDSSDWKLTRGGEIFVSKLLPK